MPQGSTATLCETHGKPRFWIDKQINSLARIGECQRVIWDPVEPSGDDTNCQKISCSVMQLLVAESRWMASLEQSQFWLGFCRNATNVLTESRPIKGRKLWSSFTSYACIDRERCWIGHYENSQADHATSLSVTCCSLFLGSSLVVQLRCNQAWFCAPSSLPIWVVRGGQWPKLISMHWQPPVVCLALSYRTAGCNVHVRSLYPFPDMNHVQCVGLWELMWLAGSR